MVSRGQADDLVSSYLKEFDTAHDIKLLMATLEDMELKTGLLEVLPLEGPISKNEIKRFSSLFGDRRDPLTGRMTFHMGVDIAAEVATPIRATADGSVIEESISYNGYGFQLLLAHGHGFRTRYAHMYFLRKRKGDLVKKGEVIGFVGSTGKSTGNHLHYEIIKDGDPRDPLPYLEFFKEGTRRSR